MYQQIVENIPETVARRVSRIIYPSAEHKEYAKKIH